MAKVIVPFTPRELEPGRFFCPKGADTMATILQANQVDMTKYNQVEFTRRVRLLPVDDVLGAIKAIIQDWEGNDLLKVESPVGLVLADFCYYAGLDPVETLGADLAAELRKREVI